MVVLILTLTDRRPMACLERNVQPHCDRPTEEEQ